MEVTGTVVSVEIDVQVAKNGGGTYPGSRLTYRDADGALKEKAFHQNVFKFNKELKAQLTNIQQAGTQFVMDMQKEGEFWNVKSIMPAGVVSAKPTNDTPATGKTAAYQAPKSTYATPEERAQTQVYIVRQSAINAAVALTAANATHFKKEKAPADIIEIAKHFENYVFNAGDNKKGLTLDDFPGDEKEIY
jgi:hypothetical protein